MNGFKRICVIILGLVLLVAGILKLMDPVGSGLVMDEYFNFFHLGFLKGASRIFASAFALIESVLGAALITGVWRKVIGIISGSLLAFFTLLTIILCVVIRGFVGAATGWLFQLFKKLDKHRIWCYFAGGLAAPMLNTILFMGYIVLVFYQTDFIQNMVASKGAVNPLMFIILVVGIQGLVEWITGCIVAGAVTKAVAHVLKRD